MHTYIGLHWAR